MFQFDTTLQFYFHSPINIGQIKNMNQKTILFYKKCKSLRFFYSLKVHIEFLFKIYLT